MKRIGYKTITYDVFFDNSIIKRDLLLFDKVVYDKTYFKYTKFNASLWGYKEELPIEPFIADLEFLKKEGFVDLVDAAGEFHKKTNSTPESAFLERMAAKYLQGSVVKRDENLIARKYCNFLNAENTENYIPILNKRTFDIVKPKQESEEVLNILLKKFPVPSSDCSLEEIIDFKNNEEIQRDYRRLRSWFTKMSSTSLSAIELEEEIEYLLGEFENRMRLQKMKFNYGNIEILVVTVAEVLENIVKLNWGKAAKILFDIKKIKIDMQLGETKAPGREVAYLHKANEKFMK